MKIRTNLTNDGRAAQEMVRMSASAYERQGRLMLRKIDPPCRIVGSGPARRVIFMPNPWLDFAGTWTERGGRMLILEIKSTNSERLAVGTGGITAAQCDSLLSWHQAGAACGVLWHRGDDWAYIHPVQIAGEKSMSWIDCEPIPRGTGMVICDFLSVLSKIYPA